MVSVLFVDDDAACLPALREAYDNHAHGWETLFVPGAGPALDTMADRPVDAVVTSARLSGIGAASFLRLTKQQHPRTARIALSNPGDRSAMLRTLPVANPCLSRSCGPDVLAKVVLRTTRLQNKLFTAATQSLGLEVGALPSLPSSLVALDDGLSNEDCSLAQIADIMSGDVAMVAKVLQLDLLSQWGMGYHIVEAITCHREPWSGPAHDPELGDVVRVADHLAAGDHTGAPEDDVIDVDLASHGPKEGLRALEGLGTIASMRDSG